MIVECYSADVYCDWSDHCSYILGGKDVFTGRNKRETDRERRRAGWIKIRGKDVCPECAAEIKERCKNRKN